MKPKALTVKEALTRIMRPRGRARHGSWVSQENLQVEVRALTGRWCNLHAISTRLNEAKRQGGFRQELRAIVPKSRHYQYRWRKP